MCFAAKTVFCCEAETLKNLLSGNRVQILFLFFLYGFSKKTFRGSIFNTFLPCKAHFEIVCADSQLYALNPTKLIPVPCFSLFSCTKTFCCFQMKKKLNQLGIIFRCVQRFQYGTKLKKFYCKYNNKTRKNTLFPLFASPDKTPVFRFLK